MASVPVAATRTVRAHLAFPRREPRSTKPGSGSGSRESPTRDRHCRESMKMPARRASALMRYAGLDPEHGLLRWGNYDRTLLLPSTVFEADDTGRSYRLRPCVDAIWLRTNIDPE